MSFLIPESNFFPVVIIGGGPCALALSSRLCTTTSHAEYSDSEHQRYHWLRRRHSIDSASTGSAYSPQEILVLDKLGDKFMCQWDAQFHALGIRHLRSPMFFHPDTSDIDALHGYAYETGREEELMEIQGVVGRDPHKHQKKGRRESSTVEVDRRSWIDFYRPGTKLFKDFCESVENKRGIQGVVRQGEVVDVQYGQVDIVSVNGTVNSGKGFKVVTSQGQVYGCGVCISAMGPSGKINYPLNNELDQVFPAGSCHSSHLFSQTVKFPPSNVQQQIQDCHKTEVIIVGGGLSSAQLAEKAIHMGISKVHFVTRGEIKVQHFDFGLEWVTKNKNYVKTQFWQESDEERHMAAIKARRGGSVNPQYLAVLEQLEKSGKVAIYRHSEVHDKQWDECTEKWGEVTLKHNRTGQHTTINSINYIVYCTGSTPDVNTEVCLQSLLSQCPIKAVHGFPCLTDDLQWNDNIPFFMVGRYAMLRTGPSSANLDGGRLGAERVGWKIQALRLCDDVFGGEKVKVKEHGLNKLLACTGGRTNWFSCLEEVIA